MEREELERRIKQRLRETDAAAETEGEVCPMKRTVRHPADMCVASVQEARHLMDIYGGEGNAKYSRALAEYVMDPDTHVIGDAADWHNFITAYMGMSDYYTALRLCEYSTKYFPNDIDLIANSIRAAGNCSDIEKGNLFVERIKRIDKRFWNWRVFSSLIGYYQNRLLCCQPEEMEALYEEGLKTAREFQKYLPLDERGYNKEAEMLLFANRRSEARAVLYKAIKEKVMVDGEAKTLIAPQCCLTLIDEILDIEDEYDEIIAASEKGIQYTTQEQPSARIGYFVYRKAMAMDAKVVRDQYRNKADIEGTLRVYQCAYGLNKTVGYARTIRQRFAILQKNAVNPIPEMTLEDD